MPAFAVIQQECINLFGQNKFLIFKIKWMILLGGKIFYFIFKILNYFNLNNYAPGLDTQLFIVILLSSRRLNLKNLAVDYLLRGTCAVIDSPQ